jgi:formiminoglutamase
MSLDTSQNFTFVPGSSELIESNLNRRSGETKIGEKIHCGGIIASSKFIILGIEESMGPQSNGGLKGSENGFHAFLKRFLNMQSNRFLSGEQISLIGTIVQKSDFQNEIQGRRAIEELDALVESTLTPFLSENITPIVIGGGHNNAYPIIKSISKKFGQKINVVNLDPHADCRPLEGRHSGNPFSYAKTEGYLNDYALIGLHKSYNSEFILNYLEENNFFFSFFDDYISDPELFQKDLMKVVEQMNTLTKFGIELDLDSIQFMPSSAFTSSGFTVDQARNYLKTLSSTNNCSYLHLPEGAPRNEVEEKIVGKTLAYFVWDFITSQIGK